MKQDCIEEGRKFKCCQAGCLKQKGGIETESKRRSSPNHKILNGGGVITSTRSGMFFNVFDLFLP